MSKLFVLIAAAIFGWFSLAVPSGPVLAAPDSTMQAHGYDGHRSSACMPARASERGCPATYDRNTRHAADRQAHFAVALVDRPASRTETTYDDGVTFVQVVLATHTTQAEDPASGGALWVRATCGVAAKSVDDLPTVNCGQQSKHFPGHPNFIPGRSTLTANPGALIQRAGTGTPVGRVPRGQAGFKERIDFGDSIGSYVSRDGASSPTSIGILHYRADGSVHIIPGRPQ